MYHRLCRQRGTSVRQRPCRQLYSFLIFKMRNCFISCVRRLGLKNFSVLNVTLTNDLPILERCVTTRNHNFGSCQKPNYKSTTKPCLCYFYSFSDYYLEINVHILIKNWHMKFNLIWPIYRLQEYEFIYVSISCQLQMCLAS